MDSMGIINGFSLYFMVFVASGVDSFLEALVPSFIK